MTQSIYFEKTSCSCVAVEFGDGAVSLDVRRDGPTAVLLLEETEPGEVGRELPEEVEATSERFVSLRFDNAEAVDTMLRMLTKLRETHRWRKKG